MLLFPGTDLTPMLPSHLRAHNFFTRDVTEAGILEDGNIVKPERYKAIRQTYEDQRRFVTLYDTENKIPVFSAYKYRGQLEERNTNNMWDGKYHKQAIDDDYKNNSRGYNRGHLFPNSYALDLKEKNSTFTLTNIVPQAESFNNGSWRKMETCTKCILEKYCINNNDAKEAFLVTGAQPSINNTT
ncbi:endonuclease domain-containing 1 protein-like [Perca fluviatilis]|uniref:endonuclease domain-containing 1 protein-like n=1 Tax=Perca fluviatilis TaxID=8168 RepID=UPI001966BBFF|nr:endonuclease domain-containing 1 protein-like [Perca fluviatilis]